MLFIVWSTPETLIINIIYIRFSEVKWSEVSQLCPTLCEAMDCSLPVSSVHGIFQARVLEWVAFSFSKASSQPRDRTPVSHTTGRRFTVWATLLTEPVFRSMNVTLGGLLLLFSHQVMPHSLWPHRIQHTRLPCPSSIQKFAQIHVHWIGVS